MARRRMIEVSIAHDKKFNSMSEFAQLLYLKVLPHTDDFGRFEGDPEVVKARVDPFSKHKAGDFETAMAEIATAGLWTWFQTPDGRRVVQYNTAAFERINAFLIKKRGQEEFPEYKDSYQLISSDIPSYHIVSIKQKVESRKQKEERPESLEAVKTLFSERGYADGLAEEFFNYYQSNGWKVGRNPMKDWRAAATNWNQHAKQYAAQRGETIDKDPLSWTKYLRKNQ
jgi:hypothetical protein